MDPTNDEHGDVPSEAVNEHAGAKQDTPRSIDSFRPNCRVTVNATKDENSAARYNDDMNIIIIALPNLQYWFVSVSAFCFRYTNGKNFFRNESMDATPPV